MREEDEDEALDPLFHWTSAVEFSVRDGDVEALRDLLKGNRDVGVASAQMHVGARRKDPVALKTLLMNIDPVHTACAAGHRELVRYLVTVIAPWGVTACDRECGATALHTCARFGRDEIARDLLGYGAPVDKCDRGGSTPLHIACEHDNENMVRLLLDVDAAVDERDKNGCTPLFVSVRAGGSPAVLQLLLDRGAAVDAAPDGEPTSLALASGMGCLTTIRLLASAGANLLAVSENLGGETALHLAAKNGSEGALCFLLAAGCWAGTEDADGRVPLASACAGGRVGTAAVLLTGQGWGREHIPNAVPPDLQRHVLSFLVAAPDAPDSNGNTPLLAACEHRGTAAVLDLLAANGADFARTNRGGETALHVACRRGNADIARYLLQREFLASSPISTPNGMGITAAVSAEAKDARGRRPGEVRDIDVSPEEALAVREVVGRESVMCTEDG